VSFHAFLQERRRRETALEGALRPRDLGHQTKAGTAAGDEFSASDGHLGGLRGTRPNAQQLAHLNKKEEEERLRWKVRCVQGPAN